MSTEISENGKESFYSKAVDYWSKVPATVDGMLGGFGYISEKDIKDSRLLLKQLFDSVTPPDRDYALDCGAGIGRITKILLTDFFEKVDLVEQNPMFLEQAKTYLGRKLSKVVNFYQKGLQNFQPDPKKYDVIWIQWVIQHLTDSDFVNFLLSCQEGLKPNGLIIVKDNITSSDESSMDDIDSSVTRPLWLFREIFDKANLECYRQVKQRNFPKGIYPVYMFVLRRKKSRPSLEKIEHNSIDKSLQSLGTSNFNSKDVPT